MPFKSVRQRKLMFARYPKLARKWLKKYGSKIKPKKKTSRGKKKVAPTKRRRGRVSRGRKK